MFNNNGIRPQGSRASNSSTPPPRTTSTPPHTPPHVPQPEPPVSAALEGLAAGGSPPRSPRRGEGPTAAQGRVDAHSSCGDIVAAWVNAAAPGEQRREAAVRVALSVSNGTTALNLFDLGLRTLPPRLHSLGHLRSMVASGNHLAGPFDRHALPSHLEHLAMMRTELTLAPDLQDLTELSVLMLDQNRLTVAPVVGMLPLRILSLSNNQISVPPDLHLLTGLQALTLDNNLLVAVPDVRGLNDLMILNLSGNRLTTVPPWIADLPGTLNIQLDDNPLSAETIAFLQNLQTGPRILHSMVVARDEGPPASLTEQVGIWLATQPEMPQAGRQALQERWADFESEPDAALFARLLRRLEGTADFQNSAASRKALGQRAVEVLDALSRDEALRLQCFSVAREGLDTCDDRVALTFSDIEVATRALTLAGQPDELLKLGHGLHRLALVDEIAREDMAARHGGIDEVEVVLGYRVMLAEPLGLPAQPSHMLYARCANLSEATLEQATQRVLARERDDPGARIEAIAKQPFWQAVLQQQPACADELAHLLEQRTRHAEELTQAYEEAQLRATKEELENPHSDLHLQYEERYAEIGKRCAEDAQATHRQFTRIAMDRVAAGQPLFDARPTPGHVIAVVKMSDVAVQIQGLIRQGQTAEARLQATRLLQPRLVAQLHSQSPSDMGPREAGVMDLANIRYLDLLTTLANEGLLDAKQVFTRLLGADGSDGETPYLMHIASRVGAGGQRDMPPAAPRLAQACVQLLDTLATARERAEEKNARADMRHALLTQAHTRHTGKLAKEKYAKYVDFYSRLLLSGSPKAPGDASLGAARELGTRHLLPTRGEVRAVRLSGVRADKFEGVERTAARVPHPKTTTPPDARLDDVVRAMGQLDVSGAQAADALLRARQREMEAMRQREEKARSRIYAVVSSAVDQQWEKVERQTRKALAPSTGTFILNPEGAAAYGRATQSLPRTAPADLAGKVFGELMSRPEGQAVFGSLVTQEREYRDQEHPRFHRMLQNLAGMEVVAMLGNEDRRVCEEAERVLDTWRLGDADLREERKRAMDAAMEQDTRRVQTHASQFATADAAPSAWSEGPSAAKRPRMEDAGDTRATSPAATRDTPARQGPGETPIGVLPSVPTDDPVRASARLRHPADGFAPARNPN